MKTNYFLMLFLIIASEVSFSQNYSLSFVEKTDVITVGAADIAPPWTAEMWVYKKATSEYSTILNGSTSKLNIETWQQSQKVGITQKGVADISFPSGYVVPINTWTHLAWVCNGAKTYLYINGVKKDSLSQVINLPMTSIGSPVQVESPNANLDEIRLWKVARTSQQILSSFNKSVSTPDATLVSYIKADDQAATVTDIAAAKSYTKSAGVTYVLNTNMASNFTSSNPTIATAQTIIFTDRSVFKPTSWSWSFPGGTPSTSTLENPTITYNTAGTYDVSLTTTTSYGTAPSVTKTAYVNVVTVTNPPVANFSTPLTTIHVNGAVNFTDKSTNYPTSWLWSFPGGTPSTSTLQNPTVSYSAAGTYNVTLTATNGIGTGNPVTKTQYVSVFAPSISTDKTTYATGEPIVIKFTGSSSTTDLIAVYKSTDVVGTNSNSDWLYCNSDSRTAGATVITNGTANFTSGIAAKGSYKLYMLAQGGNTILAQVNVQVSTPARTAAGKVYEDSNQNGKYDSGEPLIKDVLVSNGKDVVKTAVDGSFSLKAWTKFRFVQITVPSNYTTVGKHYLRLSANDTGYDFGLTPAPLDKRKAKFMQFADTEASRDNSAKSFIESTRQYAQNENISFMVNTGDIYGVSGMNFHSKNITKETMGVPVYYCIGNHDYYGNPGEATFEAYFGPCYYSFDVDNTHFIVTPHGGGDGTPSILQSDVSAWMTNDLANVDASKTVVVFNHDMFSSPTTSTITYGTVSLASRKVRGLIYGHWHINSAYFNTVSQCLYACSSPQSQGGIDDSGSNSSVYETEDGTGLLSVKRVPNYLYNHLAVVSPAENAENIVKDNRLKVSINTYSSTGHVDSVLCNLDGSGWVKMVKQAAWNWGGELTITTAKNHMMDVKVYFNDATRLVSKSVNFTSATSSFTIDPTANILKNDNIVDVTRSKLTRLWTQNIGQTIWMASPVFANNKIMIASAEESWPNNNFLCALDIFNGSIAWKYKTDNPIRNTISYSDNNIMGTTVEGHVYAVNVNTGILAWDRKITTAVCPNYVGGGTVDNGVYYTGNGLYLHALSAGNGNILWKQNSWSVSEGIPMTMKTYKDILLSGAHWNSLKGLNKTTGITNWSNNTQGLRYRTNSGTFLNDTLYIGADNGILTLKYNTGEILTKKYTSSNNFSTTTSPVITDKFVYAATTDIGLVAFDRYTCVKKWVFTPGYNLFYTNSYSCAFSTTDNSSINSTPVILNNVIYFGASDGYLYAVNALDGSLIQKINLGSPILSTPKICGNMLITADYSGNINCFLIGDGVLTPKISANISNPEIEEQISIFPNPANDKINIDLNLHLKKATIEVYNSSGFKLFSDDYKEKTCLDIGKYSNGVYFIKIKSDMNVIYTGKFIKKNNCY